MVTGGRGTSDQHFQDFHVFDTGKKTEINNRRFQSIVIMFRLILCNFVCLNKDLFLYFTASRQWLQPTVEGSTPEGRGVHTVSVVGNQLVLYGGSSDFRDMQCHKFYNDLHTIHTG